MEATPVRDPRLPPVHGRAADARAQGHRLQAHRPAAGGLQGRAAALRLPRRHRAGAEDRREQGPGLARDRPRARPAQPEPPLFPADPEQRAAVEEAERFGDEDLSTRCARSSGGRCKRDTRAAAQLLGGRQARDPDRPRGEDRGADRRARGPLQRRRRRDVRADLAACPALLDTVDAWIAAGVLGRRAAERRRLPDRPQHPAWR